MKRILGILLLFVFASADAALIDRGSGFIYDDVLDITWTQDANINGSDTWTNQVAWAAGYSLTHSVYGTFDDWRLPTTTQPDPTCSGQTSHTIPQGWGVNCTGSEMGHLFNVDGISASSPDLFTNVQSNYYWSGTEFAIGTSGASAWWFHIDLGAQNASSKDLNYSAWAVLDGDVAAVPVPAAVWLFGSALGLLGWMRRKTA